MITRLKQLWHLKIDYDFANVDYGFKNVGDILLIDGWFGASLVSIPMINQAFLLTQSPSFLLPQNKQNSRDVVSHGNY